MFILIEAAVRRSMVWVTVYLHLNGVSWDIGDTARSGCAWLAVTASPTVHGYAQVMAA